MRWENNEISHGENAQNIICVGVGDITFPSPQCKDDICLAYQRGEHAVKKNIQQVAKFQETTLHEGIVSADWESIFLDSMDRFWTINILAEAFYFISTTLYA